MKTWTKIFPFFIVSWFSTRYCSRNTIGGVHVVSPYPGVWISVEKHKARLPQWINKQTQEEEVEE